MVKRIFIIVFLLTMVLGLGAQDKDGKILIDKLNLMFKSLAEKEKSSEAEEAAGLESLMLEAKKERDLKQIDAVFFKRYSRVLMVLRLMVMPGKQGVLSPIFEKELGSFVEDVSGERINLSDKAAWVGVTAAAVVDEILSLYLYPDSVKARAKLLKDLEKKYGVKK